MLERMLEMPSIAVCGGGGYCVDLKKFDTENGIVGFVLFDGTGECSCHEQKVQWEKENPYFEVGGIRVDLEMGGKND